MSPMGCNWPSLSPCSQTTAIATDELCSQRAAIGQELPLGIPRDFSGKRSFGWRANKPLAMVLLM